MYVQGPYQLFKALRADPSNSNHSCAQGGVLTTSDRQQSAIPVFEEEILVLIKEKESLEASLAEAGLQLERLARKLELQIDDVRAVEQVKKHNHVLHQKLSACSAEIDTLGQQLRQATQKNSVLQQRLAEAEHLAEAGEAEIGRLRMQLAAAQNELRFNSVPSTAFDNSRHFVDRSTMCERPLLLPSSVTQDGASHTFLSVAAYTKQDSESGFEVKRLKITKKFATGLGEGRASEQNFCWNGRSGCSPGLSADSGKENQSPAQSRGLKNSGVPLDDQGPSLADLRTLCDDLDLHVRSAFNHGQHEVPASTSSPSVSRREKSSGVSRPSRVERGHAGPDSTRAGSLEVDQRPALASLVLEGRRESSQMGTQTSSRTGPSGGSASGGSLRSDQTDPTWGSSAAGGALPARSLRQAQEAGRQATPSRDFVTVDAETTMEGLGMADAAESGGQSQVQGADLLSEGPGTGGVSVFQGLGQAWEAFSPTRAKEAPWMQACLHPMVLESDADVSRRETDAYLSRPLESGVRSRSDAGGPGSRRYEHLLTGVQQARMEAADVHSAILWGAEKGSGVNPNADPKPRRSHSRGKQPQLQAGLLWSKYQLSAS